jgi:class 3 adenylate cyclase/pimeloyl-ACP methyl ester carboxylesterase
MNGVVRYAESGDHSIAYQVTGAGDLDLVLVPGFISHLEYDWEEPRHAAFLERLGSFARLIRLDKRGTGLSDRHGGISDLETRMDDIRAVMDAVGSESAAVFGYFEGGPLAVLFAATYPGRVRALVLFGTYAKFWLPELTVDERQTQLEDVVARWGDGSTVSFFAPDVDDVLRAWWGNRERLGGSPGAIRHLIGSSWITDVTDVLPAARAPAVVLYRRDDPMLAPEQAHFLAKRLPNASLVEVPGASTLPWLESGPLLDHVEEFLTGTRSRTGDERVLATILFTDIVGSTETVRRLGDEAWARMVESHHQAVRRELARFEGEEIDTAGDGFLALFDGPARAIRSGLAIEAAVAQLGLQVRLGVHTGEVERRQGGSPRGIAVHVGARISALAGPGEVLVSATTRDLVAGSGLEFEDRGVFDLKGLGEQRHVYRALRG